MSSSRIFLFFLFFANTINVYGQTLNSGPSGVGGATAGDGWGYGGGNRRDFRGYGYGASPRPGEFEAGNYPGAIMMPVSIWGASKITGLFKVTKTTTLVELISYASGPTNEAMLNKVKIKRTADKVEKTFTVDVSELIENPAAHDIPLMTNDIIYIAPKRPYLIDPQITSTIAVVASILGIVVTAYIIKDRESNR